MDVKKQVGSVDWRSKPMAADVAVLVSLWEFIASPTMRLAGTVWFLLTVCSYGNRVVLLVLWGAFMSLSVRIASVIRLLLNLLKGG